MDGLRSPYRTAPGSEPPELAGRDGELGAAAYAIDMTAAGEAANPIVFLGLRGMGKTALLRDVAQKAECAGGLVIVIEADRDLRLSEVLRAELHRALGRSETFSSRARAVLKRVVEHLPKIAYELPHDGGTFSITGAGDDSERPDDAIEATLLDLNDRLRRNGHFLAIALDEVQEAARPDLLRIVRAIHRTAGTDAPILFVGAGLPSTPAILHEVRTYTERWTKYSLGLLSPEATIAAVERPAEKLGAHWQADALQRMYEVSHGYPFFIQQYAAATWLRASTTTITAEDVEAVVRGVRSLLDASLYEPSFSALGPREADFVLALHSLGPGAHRLEDVARAMSLSASSQIGSLRARLAKKDIVFSAVRGRVEFRMPLANDYVTRNLLRIQALASPGPKTSEP